MCNFINAIIVTFNPTIEKLSECVNSLVKQVDRVIIVDNGSENKDKISSLKSETTDIIFLNDNKGIAFAQNRGVEIAFEKYNAQYLFFSDQDTVFPVDAIEKLALIHNKGEKIGCVSPFFKDHRSGYVHPSVSINTFTTTKTISPEGSKDFLPSHVIASGMLISRQAWHEVGPFREDLFIDWVDTEWCWRARKKGYSTVQTPSVMISHELGYGQKNFAGRSVTIHNSFRNYYKIRNAIFLMIYSDYEFKYRYHLFFHSVKNVVFEVLYSNDKIKSLAVVRKAISDAVLKKMNKGN